MANPDYRLIPTDEELSIRITSTEDHFTERKSPTAKRDWLECAVAFANSAPVGFPCVLFVGVTNSGAPIANSRTRDVESLAKAVSAQISIAYPPIAAFPRVFRHDDKEVLAVVIPGSDNRPHFTGQAFVREGPETKRASEAQFAQMIAARTSRVGELLKWKDKFVTLTRLHRSGSGLVAFDPVAVVLRNVDQFLITVKLPSDRLESHPLETVVISRDENNDRLHLYVRDIA